ncbi:MAG: hypothetical protein H0X30_04535 [Anaerolineae bacterium]|nr:hypothetical protein [Anaerolineae bacterium]
MTLLQQLWELAEREGQKMGLPAFYAFERIGLRMETLAPSEPGYEATPINTTVFASTGGDGDHFGLLHIDSEVQESSPIVMTIPMDFVNIIVGGNLYEFLCLGYDYGYFALCDLAYKFRNDVIKLPSPDTWVPDCLEDCADYYAEAETYLPVLRRELNLKPWPTVESRLNELQRLYRPLIRLRKDT